MQLEIVWPPLCRAWAGRRQKAPRFTIGSRLSAGLTRPPMNGQIEALASVAAWVSKRARRLSKTTVAETPNQVKYAPTASPATTQQHATGSQKLCQHHSLCWCLSWLNAPETCSLAEKWYSTFSAFLWLDLALDNFDTDTTCRKEKKQTSKYTWGIYS